MDKDVAKEIISQMNNASDEFILYDRASYSDGVFKQLSLAIQELKNN